jgi:hypothetical protein
MPTLSLFDPGGSCNVAVPPGGMSTWVTLVSSGEPVVLFQTAKAASVSMSPDAPVSTTRALPCALTDSTAPVLLAIVHRAVSCKP